MAQMVPITLTRDVDDLLTGYSAGALLYLYSSATETGTYAAVGSGTAIVTGTQYYEVWDASGTFTTWYKSRVGNSGGTAFEDYSPAVQVGSGAYADLADLKLAMDLPSGATRDPYLIELLADASELVDSTCHRSFRRNPASGDGTFYFDISRAGQRRLSFAIGAPVASDGTVFDIVSITTLSMLDSEDDASYTTVAAGNTGYWLLPGEQALGPSVPSEDIELALNGTNFTTFPVGRRIVKLVGALGFTYVPARVRQAVVDEARERYRQGPGGGPSQVGTNQFGVPILLTGLAPTMRALSQPGSPYVRRSYAST